jgi:hypothetical protein
MQLDLLLVLIVLDQLLRNFGKSFDGSISLVTLAHFSRTEISVGANDEV